eukprot:3005958-Rhodomonas_salina.2
MVAPKERELLLLAVWRRQRQHVLHLPRRADFTEVESCHVCLLSEMGKERGDYSFYTMRFRMAVPLAGTLPARAAGIMIPVLELGVVPA